MMNDSNYEVEKARMDAKKTGFNVVMHSCQGGSRTMYLHKEDAEKARKKGYKEVPSEYELYAFLF